MSFSKYADEDQYYLKSNYEYRYDIKPSGLIYDRLKMKYVHIMYKGTINKSKQYPSVLLVDANNKKQQLVLHKLLAMNFLNGYQAGLVVNHIDGDKTNFDLSNLEWVTPSENTKKAYETKLIKNIGLSRDLDSLRSRKIDIDTLKDIMSLIMSGLSNRDISKKYEVDERYISSIRYKKKFRKIWDILYPGAIPPQSIKEYETPNAEWNNSKFDLNKQLEIMLFLRYLTNIEVGRLFNIDASVLSNIRYNKTWKTAYTTDMENNIVPIPVSPIQNVHYEYNRRELNDVEIDMICSALANQIKLHLKFHINEPIYIQKMNVLLYQLLYYATGSTALELDKEKISYVKDKYFS